MTTLTTEIKFLDLDIMQTLFELLADNQDCIEDPLKSKLQEFIDSEDKGWVSWSDIAPEFISNESCLVMLNGEDVSNVTGYNKILRKVKVVSVVNDRNLVEVIKADSFSINNVGFANFVEWS